MTTIEVKTNNKGHIAKVPASWHECSFSQIVYLIRMLQSNRPLFILEAEFLPILRLNIFKALVGLTSENIDNWHKDRVKEYGEDGDTVFLTELNECVDEVTGFLFTKYTPPATIFEPSPKEETVIAPDLLKCPLPSLQIPLKKGIRTLYAPSCGKNARSKTPIPDEVFQNMTIYELGTAFQLYETWLETNDNSHLIELIATIYRDKKPPTRENRAKNYEGDIRLPLRGYEATIPQRKDLIAKLMPAHVMEAIAFWFGCCRHHFAAEYPEIFNAPTEGGTPNRFGYASIILELSRSAHISKNEIADQDAHSTMVEMIFEHEKAKAAIPKD